MSSKLDFIPHITSYDDIRREMEDDLLYRLSNRHEKTALGRPLYYRINTQIVVTQECPHACPFCLERQNPMTGNNNFEAQIEALKKVLKEHPAARLTITGGEPGLYPDHIKRLVDVYRNNGDDVFCSINTSGWNKDLNNLDAHINLSVNDYVASNPEDFPGCTVQTIMKEESARWVKQYMDTVNAKSFSFRFLTGLNKKDYPINIWNELQNDPEIDVHTCRIGDFFMYVTFDCHGKHARITLGDMYQQRQNDYQDGYSNIIIHPDGRIGINWH